MIGPRVALAAVLGLAGVLAAATARPAPPPPAGSTVRTLPVARGGQDLVGTRWPKPRFDRRLRPDRDHPARPSPAPPDRPRATLYRWWTDGCPFCERSLPAIEALRAKHAGRGLDVVAVYHPKPPRAVTDAFVRAAAATLGYGGTIAVDADWSALRRAYLDTGDRAATSVTFLVDATGVVRFVHPGPELFPSAAPAHRRENEDYRMLDAAIGIVIAEPAAGNE